MKRVFILAVTVLFAATAVIAQPKTSEKALWKQAKKQAKKEGRVLDLFGGCGQLAIEALSRGAKSATIVDLSKKSVEDLSNIWRYTAIKWSIKQADKYYNILISFCKNIATNPFLYGMKYDEIIDEYYFFHYLLQKLIGFHIYSIQQKKNFLLKIWRHKALE